MKYGFPLLLLRFLVGVHDGPGLVVENVATKVVAREALL